MFSLRFFLPLLSSLVIFTSATRAATESDITRLSSYAVMLGQAVGCGLSTSSQASRVSEWMDRHFAPGSVDRQMYLPTFSAGVRESARRQSQGQSSVDCDTVREQFALVDWP